MLDRGLRNAPEHLKCQMERLGVQMNLATLNRQRGKPQEAEALFLSVISTSDRLAQLHPTEPPLRVTSSAANNNLSILYQRAGKLKLADLHLSRSRELKEGLFREQPENKRYRYLVAASYVNSGDLEGVQSRRGWPLRGILGRSPCLMVWFATIPRTDFRKVVLARPWKGWERLWRKMRRWVEAVPVLADRSSSSTR